MKGLLTKSGKEKMQLITSRKEKDSKRSAKAVFGVPLDTETTQVPPVLVKCVEYLDTTGLEFEGIFRKSASVATMNEYKAKFDKG